MISLIYHGLGKMLYMFLLYFISERLHTAIGITGNSAPFDVTGHPAISVNAGFAGIFPVGMMVVGRHFDDTSVLQVAHAYEVLYKSQTSS